MPLPVVDDVSPSGPRSPGAPTGRRSSYTLRVSVLEQCQLDCRYCRPGSVVPPNDRSRWLTPAEHARLAPLFGARGVRKVRFTGGEPTLRSDLVDLVAAWSGIGASLALTTNGLRLPPLLPALRRAGLGGVTVHLDTLRADRVREVMGDGASVVAAFDAMEQARALGFEVKWNCVVQLGVNDDEIASMIDESARRGVEIRFIEQMNTGSARGYVKETFLAGADIVAVARSERGARPLPRRHPSDPATLWASRSRAGQDVVFGVIASDTEPFCDACDRLRLSADGRVRGCLYEPGGLALGTALRGGADDQALASLLDDALDNKASHHPRAAAARRAFSMADVGG